MKRLSEIWMVLSTVIIIVLAVISKTSVLQIIAAVSGVIYVFGVALENRYAQLFGIVNSVLYGLIMYNSGILGTAIYDIVYCMPMQIYTFFRWGKTKDGKKVIKISRYSNLQRVGIIMAILAAVFVYYIIAIKLNIQFALIDGASVILGALGLYMASNKKIEQWYCFIASNIVMVVLWSVKSIGDISNITMVAMWIIYIINNTYGAIVWNKKIRQNS